MSREHENGNKKNLKILKCPRDIWPKEKSFLKAHFSPSQRNYSRLYTCLLLFICQHAPGRANSCRFEVYLKHTCLDDG